MRGIVDVPKNYSTKFFDSGKGQKTEVMDDYTKRYWDYNMGLLKNI